MVYKALVDFKDIASGKEYMAGDTVDLSGAPASKIQFMLSPNKSRGALIEEAETTEDDETNVDNGEDLEPKDAETDEPQGV